MNTSRSTPNTTPEAAWPLGDRAAAFRARHFPDCSDADWHDWRWQLRCRFRTLTDLERILELADDERQALAELGRALPVALTPYYAALLEPKNPDDPLRRTMIPVPAEFSKNPGEELDPLAEEDNSPVPGLVHRYPDRVLFLVAGQCPVYCRYCTRARLVGSGHNSSKRQWQQAIDYVAAHPEVHDVLISGGDPLILADAKLEWLLARLRAIPHLDLIRIGTKAPMALPQRITRALCRLLQRFHPLFMSIHVTHPNELTPEAARACQRLADAGIPLGSQTVLLEGVNDDLETITDLMRGLLRLRVRPYYLLQCDPVWGSAHFRTPVAKGLELLRGLRGRVSGYAIPQFILDLPGGGGKVPLVPDYVTGRDGDDLLITNYQGKPGFRYHDPLD